MFSKIVRNYEMPNYLGVILDWSLDLRSRLSIIVVKVVFVAVKKLAEEVRVFIVPRASLTSVLAILRFLLFVSTSSFNISDQINDKKKLHPTTMHAKRAATPRADR